MKSTVKRIITLPIITTSFGVILMHFTYDTLVGLKIINKHNVVGFIIEAASDVATKAIEIFEEKSC